MKKLFLIIFCVLLWGANSMAQVKLSQTTAISGTIPESAIFALQSDSAGYWVWRKMTWTAFKSILNLAGGGTIINYPDAMTIQNNPDNTLATKGTVQFGANGSVSSASINTDSLQAVITRTGTGTVTIATAGTIALNSISIPETITLKIIPGSILAPGSGQTLTINNFIDAPKDKQIFAGNGTVLTPNQKVYSEWWGAKGDNSTDNVAAIRKAFNSTSPEIEFIGSTYLMSDSVYLDLSGRKIKLSSSTNSMLFFSKTTNAGNYYSPEGCLHLNNGKVEIEGVTLRGTNAGISPFTHLLSVLQITNCSKVTLDNVTITNGIYAGVQFINDSNLVVTKCTFNSNSYAGAIVRGTKGIKFVNCTTNYNGYISGSDTTGYGINIGGRFQYPYLTGNIIDNEDVLIQGCTANYNKWSSIDVHGGIGVKILNCTVKGFGIDAIRAISEGGGEVGFEKVVKDVLIADNHIGQDSTWYANTQGSTYHQQIGIAVGLYTDGSVKPINDGGIMEVRGNQFDTLRSTDLKFGILVYGSTDVKGNIVKVTGNTFSDTSAEFLYGAICIAPDSGASFNYQEASRNTVFGHSAIGLGIYTRNGRRQVLTNNYVIGKFHIPLTGWGSRDTVYMLGNIVDTLSGGGIRQDLLQNLINTQLNFRAGQIENNVDSTDHGVVAINYAGYGSGTTKYRDFEVYDGKNNLLLQVNGLAGQVHLAGDLTSNDYSVGATTSTNGLTFKNGLFISGTYAASHNYYVDRDATGNGDALSWTNASKTIVDLPWSSINGGDTVYVSGGTDSTVYYQYDGAGTNYISKIAIGSHIVVTKSWEAGHNGDVYIEQTGSPSKGFSCLVSSSAYIKLTNLIFSTNATDPTSANILYINESSNIIIDNCQMISNGNGDPLRMNNPDFITVNNCTLKVLANASTDTYQDVVYFTGGVGGNIFTNNHFINESVGCTDASMDMIQGSLFGSTSNYQTVVANNFFYFNVPNAIDFAHAIYFSPLYTNRILTYNNIFAVTAGLTVYSSYGDIIKIGASSTSYHVSARIYNNTIVTARATPISILIADTVIIKNNIAIIDSNTGTYGRAYIAFGGMTTYAYKDISYNHYWTRNPVGSPYVIDSTNHSIDWGAWKALYGLNLDAHSDTDAVSFINIWGPNATDYKLSVGSKGIDQGTAVPLTSPAFDGVLRPWGDAYDMGAFEYNY